VQLYFSTFHPLWFFFSSFLPSAIFHPLCNFPS
jgi:hypothetical protein